MHVPLVISSPVARLICEHNYLMIITAEGRLSLWDVSKFDSRDTCLIKSEAMGHLFLSRPSSVSKPNTPNDPVGIVSTSVTETGAPLISLSTGKTFTFDVNYCCWTFISSAGDPLAHSSDLKQASKKDPLSHPLSALQSLFKLKTSHNVFASNSILQQSATLSYIDQQLAASFVLNSSKEYRYWLLKLATHLTDEAQIDRLKELCEYLLGPVYEDFSGEAAWEKTILGNEKRELLLEVLVIMTTNLKLQRLYGEFKDLLDTANGPSMLFKNAPLSVPSS